MNILEPCSFTCRVVTCQTAGCDVIPSVPITHLWGCVKNPEKLMQMEAESAQQ
jgi:hypothetical protein